MNPRTGRDPTRIQIDGEQTNAKKLVNDIVSLAVNYNPTHKPPNHKTLKSMIVEFLTMTPQNDAVKAKDHLQILATSAAPHALVILYNSSHRLAGSKAIRELINTSNRVLPKNTLQKCFTPIVEKFCSMLSVVARIDDPLYCFCRSALRAMERGGEFSLQRRFTVFKKLVSDLLRDLDLRAELSTCFSSGPSWRLVRDFNDFVIRMRKRIKGNFAFRDPVVIPSSEKLCALGSYRREIVYLHEVFLELLSKLEKCLVRIENNADSVMEQDHEASCLKDCQYLSLLKGLNGISKLYCDCEKVFWETLKRRESALSCLILKYVKRGDDYNWILEYKEVINFEARRHLAMMMLHEVKHECERPHEMLISRLHLLEESFGYIAQTDPQSLRSGLSVVFENEEAIGPGVLREWFFLVCQEMVNPLNSLFVACPNDCQRFFPNPASRVDPLHLEYFSFCGRVIALALMHKVQVGIVFDRVFFLRLAGCRISLEDIQSADPILYRSCKQILEMDPETVDLDVLGLTFAHETEEFRARQIFDLVPSGRRMVVNSENRNQFVDSLIHHRFVTAISEQTAHFARGFSDIMSCQWPHRSFFRCLDVKDLDWMLHGCESAISVDDWKAHTDYHGFKEPDPQISWFWEIVECLSIEQKRILLFFWTSIKYLPVEGFGGLASRLCISKMFESLDHLPSARTCLYQLRFPAYRSFCVMHNRLSIITQEHIGCCFGTV